MRRMLALAAMLTVFCGGVAFAATTTKPGDYPLVNAVELRARGGLPNLFAKLAKGGEVRVGYIGGSITAQPGWRPKVTALLAKQYPNAKIVEINASIGGTGSDLGVFRFGQDVLAHRPDMVFVEFAVNDGGYPPAQIHRCMEGMVRQAWAQDPAIDICFVYTLVEGFVPTLAQGKFPRAASAMEAVADHYAIPTIHMGLEITRLATEGKMVMKANPKTDEEKAALKDKIIFSGDGVHPHPETGHVYYLEAVARSLEKMKALGSAGPHTLGKPLMSDNYEKARLVPITSKILSGTWRKLDSAKDSPAKNFAKFLPEMYACGEAGASITFRFKGTYVAFLDLLGPDCGQLKVNIDGGKPTTAAQFDPYCTYHRIGSLVAARDLSDGVHTVTVTIDNALPDKPAILARLNNKMDNPKRFEGHVWYVSRIMIIGELSEAEASAPLRFKAGADASASDPRRPRPITPPRSRLMRLFFRPSNAPYLPIQRWSFSSDRESVGCPFKAPTTIARPRGMPSITC